MKLQMKGLTFVGILIAIAGVILVLFFRDMADNALMGESPRYKAVIPAVPATDIASAPQCTGGYDKKWIGCQSLAQ